MFTGYVLLLSSCSSTKPTATSVRTTNASASTHDPKFIKNISLDPSGRSSASTHASGGPSNNNTNTLSAPELFQPLQFKYAILLNASVEDISDMKLWQFIDSWWGTRYHYGGTTQDGIDCSGFTGMLMSNVYGITLPRTAKEQYQQTKHVKKDKLQLGDLVFFNTRGGVSHVGMYLMNNKFVHASTSGVTISGMDDDYYSRRFVGAGRPKSS